MITFAPEILDNICSHLDVASIKELRLVNKDFAKTAGKYIKNTFFLHTTNPHFKNLVDFSKHPRIAQGIHSLVYAPITLDEHGRKYYEDQMRTPQGSEPRKYHKYMVLLRQQHRIMNTRHDYKSLKKALPRFPRLQHIAVHFSDMAFVYPKVIPHVNELRDCTPFVVRDHDGLHLRRLMQALSDAKVSIDSLTLNQFHWEGFHKRDAEDRNRVDPELHALFKPVAGLKSLHLLVDNDADPNLDGSGLDFSACTSRMPKGTIQTCLAVLESLDTLTVSFTHGASIRIEDGWQHPLLRGASLNDIVPPAFTWTSLRTLKLGNIHCKRQELMEFLMRHKSTLRELCLEEIYLIDTSWIPFLASIRQELYLTKPCVCGIIDGHWEGGDNDQELQRWKLFPAVPDRRVPAKEVSLHTLANEYILKGWEAHPEMDTCPLTCDNCEPGAMDFEKWKKEMAEREEQFKAYDAAHPVI